MAKGGDELKLAVRFGGKEIRTGIICWEATPVNDPDRHGTLSFARGALSVGVDYSAEVQVFDESDGSPEVLFTGIVWSALPRDDGGLDLEVRTGSQVLREQRMGGLILGANMSALEALYSLLRLGGVKPEKMMIEGISFPLRNPFEIAAPITGIHVTEPFIVGDVTFVSDGPVSKAVDDLLNTPAAGTTMTGGGNLLEGYRGASCWASTTVQASSLDVAEELGLAQIRQAIAWVSLCAKYSFSKLRDRDEREFRRDVSASSSIELSNIVHVRALRTAHRWLRCVDQPLALHIVNPAELDLKDLSVPKLTDDDVWQAVLCWERASNPISFRSKSSALWQGVEHYVKATEMSKLFSNAERKSLKRDVPYWMTPGQKVRYKEMIDKLNDVPLMPRLEEAIARDKAPISSDEFTVLQRSRRSRNMFEHGNVPSDSDSDDLRMAIGLLGRLLVYRLANYS